MATDFDVMAHMARPHSEIMADMILINRGRVHRLFDLALSYTQYDQPVIDRSAKQLQHGDTEDDIYTMPPYVAPVAPDPGLREAIEKQIKAVEHSELVDLGYVDAITNAVLAVLAERGVR